MCSISTVLVSTSTILLSKKLLSRYELGKDIVINKTKINKLLDLIDLKQSEILDDDILVCLNDKLNPIGIVKIGTSGHVTPISDKNLSFTIYKSYLPITSKIKEEPIRVIGNYMFPVIPARYRAAL